MIPTPTMAAFSDELQKLGMVGPGSYHPAAMQGAQDFAAVSAPKAKTLGRILARKGERMMYDPKWYSLGQQMHTNIPYGPGFGGASLAGTMAQEGLETGLRAIGTKARTAGRLADVATFTTRNVPTPAMNLVRSGIAHAGRKLVLAVWNAARAVV